VTACAINGYVSENDAGRCPEGTCSVLAFDTNGELLPCCTSIDSGPGICVDGGMPVEVDASEASLEEAEAAAEASSDAALDGGPEAEAEAGPVLEAGSDASD
jgi:hypothetical protein